MLAETAERYGTGRLGWDLGRIARLSVTGGSASTQPN
jgi:hypothetical protein